VGGEGVKERADFLGMAVYTGITIPDLAWMENVYSPAIGALNEPIALAAQNCLANLGRERGGQRGAPPQLGTVYAGGGPGEARRAVPGAAGTRATRGRCRILLAARVRSRLPGATLAAAPGGDRRSTWKSSPALEAAFAAGRAGDMRPATDSQEDKRRNA